MEQVKNTISIHPNGATYGRGVCLVADGVYQTTCGRWRHGHSLVFLVVVVGVRILAKKRGLLPLAGDTVRNIDASLGGVARLAWVGNVVGMVVGVRVLEGRGSGRTFGIGALALCRVGTGGGIGFAMGKPASLGGGGIALLAGRISRGGLQKRIVVHDGRIGRGRAFPLASVGRAGRG